MFDYAIVTTDEHDGLYVDGELIGSAYEMMPLLEATNGKLVKFESVGTNPPTK